MIIAQIIAGIEIRNQRRNQLTMDRTIAMIACVRMLSNCVETGGVYIGWP